MIDEYVRGAEQKRQNAGQRGSRAGSRSGAGAKGGSAKQILVRQDAHGWNARYLSAAECARLMGADGFRLDAEGISENGALFGFGDAVCVPAVTWLMATAARSRST